MIERPTFSPDQILAAEAERPKLRARDLAQALGISEAALVAARAGQGVTRIAAHPDRIMPAAASLGEVMALTRVDACVHEKVGRYDNYQSGAHAAMVLTENIDLRIFPSRWVHAFAVESVADTATRRSLQVFDAAGDVIHKIHLREGSDLAAWDRAVAGLRLADQTRECPVTARKPVEPPLSVPDNAEALRREWGRMSDTHQFRQLCRTLKMNRLGAYRVAGAPLVRALAPEAVNAALEAVQAAGIEVMIFVGNQGCIQIHTGPVGQLRPMGPWQNVMDPGFNLHLRLDRIAEVWAVNKPSRRGMAVSVEAFDAEGGLILQIFGVGLEERDSRSDWQKIVAMLPQATEVPA